MVQHSLCHAVGPLILGHLLAADEHIAIALHLLRHSQTKRFLISHYGHKYTYEKTFSYRLSSGGSGLDSAKATASSTMWRASESIWSASCSESRPRDWRAEWSFPMGSR